MKFKVKYFLEDGRTSKFDLSGLNQESYEKIFDRPGNSGLSIFIKLGNCVKRKK